MQETSEKNSLQASKKRSRIIPLAEENIAELSTIAKIKPEELKAKIAKLQDEKTKLLQAEREALNKCKALEEEWKTLFNSISTIFPQKRTAPAAGETSNVAAKTGSQPNSNGIKR